VVASHWYAVAALATLLLVGFFSARRDLDAVRKRQSFTDEYRRRFVAFATTSPVRFDHEDYDWLSRRLGAIERELGRHGRIMYKPPLAAAYIDNLPLLSDTIPKMVMRTADAEAVYYCEHILNAHAGSLETYVREHNGELWNPVQWFVKGVEFILAAPLTLLLWAGIAQPASASEIRRGFLFRVIAFVVAVVTFLSGLVIIVTGWGPFARQITEWVNKR